MRKSNAGAADARSGLVDYCFARKPSSRGVILDRRYGVNSQPALTRIKEIPVHETFAG